MLAAVQCERLNEMKNAPKPDHVSLQSLISRLREGRFVIPDFQREFEWEPKDILELMRSLFLDYYIGSLLLWRGRNDTFESLACEPLKGFAGDNGGSPEHIVLDGQQRLSAMYYAFMAPEIAAPNRKARHLYFIRIDKWVDDEPDEAFIYDWTRWSTNLLADREAQFAQHMFPLATVGDSGLFAIPEWFQDYERFWTTRRAEAISTGNDSEHVGAERSIDQGREFFAHLQEMLNDYRMAYIELDQDLEIDKVCDTFTRINSRGVRLDIFDLMNALLRPKEIRLKDMWREVAPDLEFISSSRSDVYVLQVMSILAQNYCSPKYLYHLLPGEKRRIRRPDGSSTDEVLVSNADDFERRWLEAVTIIKGGIARLSHPQDFGAISPALLPYTSIVPAFCAALHIANSAPEAERLTAAQKVRDWYWASVFTNRYSGSVESTTARDVLALRQWIEDDDAEPDPIAEFSDRLRSLDFRTETRPGSAIYKGVLNLLIINGARDWVSNAPPQPDDVDSHHIVPKSWGRANGLGSQIDSVLNRAPLSAATNRDYISSRHPNEYLPEWIERAGKAAVRETLRTHLISDAAFDVLCRKPFGKDDFDEFLSERQRSILGAINTLLVKGQLDLSPDLRELDARIDRVELATRELIGVKLNDNPSQVPQHIQPKLQERIDQQLRKQPGLDREDFNSLRRRLEYADLRELEDIIASKAVWDLFEAVFNTKQQVQHRFGQLGDLRNAIRHNRTASEVVRKDGEAALLWFEQALGVQGG